MSRDPENSGQDGARLSDVSSLNQIVTEIFASLSGTSYRYFCIRIIVLVVVAHPHQFAVVNVRTDILQLSRQEVAEAFGSESVMVEYGISLPRQRIDEHSRAGGDGRDRDLKHLVLLQTPAAYRRKLAPVRRVVREGHADVHHHGDRRIRRTRRDERDGRSGRIVRDDRLLDVAAVGHVVQVPHAAHALEEGAARVEPGSRVVYHEGLVHVVGQLARDRLRTVEHRALGRVILRAGHHGDHHRQVRRQLEQPVDGADEHAVRVLVDDHPVEGRRVRERGDDVRRRGGRGRGPGGRDGEQGGRHQQRQERGRHRGDSPPRGPAPGSGDSPHPDSVIGPRLGGGRPSGDARRRTLRRHRAARQGERGDDRRRRRPRAKAGRRGDEGERRRGTGTRPRGRRAERLGGR